MTNRYTSWCLHGCGKSVRCIKRIKLAGVYQCSRCGQFFTKQELLDYK